MFEPFLIPSLAMLIFLSWGIDYINGFHDTANSIATVVSTGVLPAKYALVMSATLNFAGALAGTSVATTIAKGLADSQHVVPAVIAAALMAAITWHPLQHQSHPAGWTHRGHRRARGLRSPPHA